MLHKQINDSKHILHTAVDCLSCYKSIGPAKIKALKAAHIHTLFQLLSLVPKITIKSEEFKAAQIAIECEIIDVKYIKNKQIITVKNKKDQIAKLLFLHKKLPFVKLSKIMVFGQCQEHNKQYTFIHPKILTNAQETLFSYNLNKPLFDSTVQLLIKHALTHISSLPTFEPKLAQFLGLDSWQALFTQLHFSTSTSTSLDKLKTLEYIAYIHIFNSNKEHQGPVFDSISHSLSNPYDTITSMLTSCQKRALDEIKEDFSKPIASKRIIFGDVGTGKTLLAVLAAMYAVSAGKKVLMLAPTTLLAEQTYAVFTRHIPNTSITLLTQKTKKHANCSNSQIVIGTHAIFYQMHHNVGLIIIDEQHKFGVKQRASLFNQNHHQPHLLTLTATPIPRTLSLVMEQYIKTSALKNKPKPTQINTYTLSSKHLAEFVSRLEPTGMVYWVCPAVEEQELGYMNVTTRFNLLKQHFNCALLHGQMTPQEQQQAYQLALSQQVQILVATTLIEVGIDIPHANMIIIEDAHRFGLAQLHQLRGRVGRNGEVGKCVLIYPDSIGDMGKQRLNLLKTIDNGFELANKDLELRGAGKIFNTQQSGFEQFNFLDLATDTNIIESAANILKELSSDTLQSLSNVMFAPTALFAD